LSVTGLQFGRAWIVFFDKIGLFERSAKKRNAFLLLSDIDNERISRYADMRFVAQCIAKEKISPMAAKENEKMTIEQVAEALGVSKTTVSRALSGKGRISEKTRAKVFAYMGHARTEPAPAQKDPKVRTNNIAMIVPQRFITLDLPFLRKCMGGICTMADQRGYDMLLCYASSTEYTQLQRQLASHKVDGVILTYAMADDPCVDLLRQYDVPFVLIGRSEDKTIPQADNDQVTAACEMTRILLQMGAKRIALLVGSTIYAVNTDRTRGYLRGFAESCVPVDQRLVHSGIESAGQTIDALEAALEQKADCLLCGDDEIAYEVMRELRNRHILVPHDLCVASLYDSSMLASITPSVSAVQYDAEQLGRTACRMLLDRLLGKEIVQRQIEGYQVILRESTKWNSRTHDGR
jgi:transcriptional regulator, lacI family